MRELPSKRHRLSADIIRHSAWLYARFTLSCRDVEAMLSEQGLDVSYETVRRGPSDHWHLDETAIVIRHKRYRLWRAVDFDVWQRALGSLNLDLNRPNFEILR